MVSNELVAEIVAATLARLRGQSIVLDGFPRNMEQAQLLGRILKEQKLDIDLALNIESTRETVVRRLSARRQCPKCNKIYGEDLPPKRDNLCDQCGVPLIQRADDKPEVIEKRFNLYMESSTPLLAHYRKLGILRNVDGNKGVEDVFRQVARILAAANPHTGG